MKTYIIHITLIFFMFTTQAFGEIIETSDLVLIQNTLKKQNQDTLVIFDVDHVLIMPTDEYSLNRNPCRRLLWEKMKQRLSEEEVKFLHSIVTYKAKWCLVDPQIINILSDLKKHFIPTIALTSLNTGKLGIIKKREDLRIQELQSFDISFTDLTPLKGTVLAPELEGTDGIPMLKDGIILTAEIDKALVLEYILHKNKYYPKIIIFIDDQLKNLESVAKLCAKLQITFLGFHYIAVSLIPPSPMDEHAEELRFQILEKEHRWLNNKELSNRRNMNNR